MSDSYTLYATPFSMYSGKARAYLDFKKIPYHEQFSTVSVFKKIIRPNTGTQMIPVVKTPQEQYLQDTALIIETLEKQFPERPVIPQTPKQKLVSFLFELWADEWLLIPAMHYRWNKDNFPFLYQEFGRVVMPYMPAFVRGMVGKKLAKKFNAYLPSLGVNERSTADIEDWYENHVLHHLNHHFESHAFILGDRASLADISLMGPLYAHLQRDPEPGRLMASIAPNVVKWIERMQQSDYQHGDWMANDAVPETLYPLLQRMFKEQWPVLLNTVLELEEWANAYPQESDIPRSIGKHNFVLNDASYTRAIMTFGQWKLQRVLSVYQSFNDTQRSEVDALLAETDGKDYLKFKVTRPVVREKGRLRFAN